MRRPEILEQVQRIIVVLRGHRVILDADLATLYGVQNRTLLQAVRRNMKRFPADFMFQLNLAEVARSRSQTVILNAETSVMNRENGAGPEKGTRGTNTKYLPYAFTEQGVAMLSTVLRSPRAIEVNIEIMRAFVRLRQMLSEHADLSRRLDSLESRYDAQFRVVFDAIRELMAPQPGSRKRIGFRNEPE